MRKGVIYLVIFGLCLFFVSASVIGDETYTPPIEFKSIEMKDLGDFHGSAPGNEQAGWNYWGGREPIVSPGWVDFLATGVYQFVVECKSQQLDPGDAEKGIFAEFDVRLHILGERNDVGKIKNLAEIVGDTIGDPVVAHGAAVTDDRIGEDWAKVTVSTADPTTGEPLIIEGGTQAQLEIWFTNDEWDDPKDRNFMVRTVAVLMPEDYKGEAVEPVSKMAVTWGRIKAK